MEKLCKYCKKVKPASEFYIHTRNKDGLQPWCKTCQKYVVVSGYRQHPEKHATYNREWGRKNPEKKADIALKTRLGLPHGAYKIMLEAQGGLCAICGRKPETTRLHVDHNANTGAIRGLLCSNCNTGIGQMKHDQALIAKAIEYLQKHTITSHPKVEE